jgi:hypothetical protein
MTFVPQATLRRATGDPDLDRRQNCMVYSLRFGFEPPNFRKIEPNLLLPRFFPKEVEQVGSWFSGVRGFFRRASRRFATTPYEYTSPRSFLGLPLLSINLGPDNPGGQMRQARGVIAVGNQATGILAFGVFTARGLFAIALFAVGLGTVSIGGLGVVAVAVAGVGLVSVSAFALGYIAVGIFSIEYHSVGIVALGREVVGIVGIGQATRAIWSIWRRS